MGYFNKEIVMNIHLNHVIKPPKRVLLTIILLLFVNVIGRAQPTGLYLEEGVVAGGPDYFMEVRHVVLKGSNYEIGRKIAEIAKRNNDQIKPSGDPLRNKVQREYMEKNYPIHYERMKGVADAFGVNIEDSAYDISSISQYSEVIMPLACSAVFYPSKLTTIKHDVLSQNFDFTTGTLTGKIPQNDEMPVVARPYVFEIYPDKGYACLYICAFDYLGGVLDGINSEGLAVAVFGETEAMGIREPTSGIGMHELMCMRYLLDTCKDVQEAKEALMYLKHYYAFLPCHYLIADRFGNSFIFEFSPLRNRTFVVNGNGPQCITNHLISKYKTIDQVPEGNDNIKESIGRLEVLRKACRKDGPFSLNEIKSINAKVAIPPYISNDRVYAQGRTLWHSIYDLDERKLSVKFYLGEKPDRKDSKKAILNYSDYLEFRLKTPQPRSAEAATQRRVN
jgi:hypothetical protein